MMDHAGHAAFETIRKIEERLETLAKRWEPPTGREVAVEIINAIREARGDKPVDIDSL